jgi:hypothetical protein
MRMEVRNGRQVHELRSAQTRRRRFGYTPIDHLAVAHKVNCRNQAITLIDLSSPAKGVLSVMAILQQLRSPCQKRAADVGCRTRDYHIPRPVWNPPLLEQNVKQNQDEQSQSDHLAVKCSYLKMELTSLLGQPFIYPFHIGTSDGDILKNVCRFVEQPLGHKVNGGEDKTDENNESS